MSDDLQIIEKAVNILNDVNWAAYGDHQATDYLAYIQGQHSDEIGLMDRLLGEFLEQLLGFTLHQDLHPQMTAKTTGKCPDYIPDDTHLHPFVFDAKGSDTTDLGQHYDQIAGYMRSKGLRYGVLTNMRDLAVYALHSRQPEADYCFSFRQLYQDYQQDPTAALEAQNTKHFLAFVHRFQRRELDRAAKIQAIIDARHGLHDAELDLDDLVRRLHEIVAVLHEDARQQRKYPPERYKYILERQQQIALEIDTIAREIAPDLPERKIKAATLKTLLGAAGDTTDGQATDRYLYRVAYFAMTRILLARVWEDIGFIDQALYDGGFERLYEWLGNQVQRVLSQAFFFASERYSWLYGLENNYTWYIPSEDVLIDVLYDFSRFDFRHLDADVLGAVYEAYLDKTDRKNKGQYYTPRPMVQFIWDRVGFNTPGRVFRFEGGERKPRVVLDFCTGSGGFLVEAARRIRETALGADFDPEDPARLEAVSLDDLILVMTALIEGLRGSEINAFAYYLTEVNLLMQLTPIIAAILKKAPHALRFGRDYALAVIHQDALKLYNRLQPTLNDNEGNRVSEFVRSDEVYERDRRHDIVILDGYKYIAYNWLKSATREADYVCSNPPYVGEKGHKELFRYYREKFDYWDRYYQGKMDYLYWFIILGLSKLRDGGRLGYITTSYWPTADGAAILRQYILERAKIVGMIDFGETRIFSDAPGQHNMVFVLERCDDEEARAANRPCLVRVEREFEGETIEERLTRLLAHIQKHIVVAPDQDFEDDYISVFWSPMTQDALSSSSWNFFLSSGAELSDIVARAGTTVSSFCQVIKGVETGANSVTRRNVEHLTDKSLLGAGIFVLTQKELDALGLSPDEAIRLKPLVRAEDLGYGLVDKADELHLLYIDDSTDLRKYPQIATRLRKFRPILENRAEFVRNPNRKWYALAWSRDEALLQGPKLIVSYRGSGNNFVYDESGSFGLSGMYFIATKAKSAISIKYISALLNSKLLDFWYAHKGKRKGKQREYVERPINDIPIRGISFDPPTEEAARRAVLDSLKAHLDAGDYDAAYATLHQALDAGQEDAVHDGLVELVDQIIALKTDLATYNHHFSTRLTRLEENDPLPEIEPLAVLQGLPATEQWSVDMHIQNGTLSATQDLFGARDDFYFHRVKASTTTSITLQARGRKADTLTLSGDRALIGYLKAVLPAKQGQFWRDVKKTLMPKDIGVYQDETQHIVNIVADIRNKVAGRQAVIDWLVLDLYGITGPDDRKLVLGKTA
ncbi:MAG: hypothetical protein E3J21_06555 [Anaerolineales bacterium]|nr:MAG: hypothetical protein E3J21_06555 [Anaerolineales bacterium]